MSRLTNREPLEPRTLEWTATAARGLRARFRRGAGTQAHHLAPRAGSRSLMHQSVVRAAEQQQVRQRRRSGVAPMDDVVRIAPRMWPVAAREPASTVARDDRSMHGGRNDRGSAADVQRLREAVHHDPHHRGVAGELSRMVFVDDAYVIELSARLTFDPAERLCSCLSVPRRRAAAGAPSCRPLRHGLCSDRHRDVRTFAAHCRAVLSVEPLPADLVQSVGAALRRRPWI
jgi:hypothetical protein